MARTNIAHDGPTVDQDDETNAALAALDAAEQAIRATRRLLAALRPAGADGARRLTLDEVRQRLGLRVSRGPDPNRSTRDRLRALGVPTVKVGRSLLVDSAQLEEALAAMAKPLRSTVPREQAEAGADELDEALGRAGLRLVGGAR